MLGSNLWMLAGTAAVAVYGLTFRHADGERSWLHLLIGAVAFALFLRVLLVDVFGFA